MTTIIHHTDLYGKREDKYEELSKNTVSTIKKKEIKPAVEFCFFVPKNEELQPEYDKYVKISDAMPTNSVGIVTARDHLCIQDTPEEVKKVVWDFASLKPEQARKKYELGDDARDWQVKLAQEDAKKSGPNKKNIVPILYRPFDLRYTYYTGKSRGFLCMPRPEVMGHMLAGVNLGLISARSNKSDSMDHFFLSNHMMETKCGERTTQSAFFSLYLYPSSDDMFQTERKPNFTKEFTDRFAFSQSAEVPPERRAMAHLYDNASAHSYGSVSAHPLELSIFRYIYAVFHSPTYRERYAEFLKIDFPRVPIPKTKELFQELNILGNDLIALHLLQEEDSELVSVSKRIKEAFNNGLPTLCRGGLPLSTGRGLPWQSHSTSVRQTRTTDKQKTQSTGQKQNPIVEKGYPKYENENVYVNEADYFESVPEDVWNFHIGGYQVLHKWLKDRRERALSEEDVLHYRKVIVSLGETIVIMREVDEVVTKFGGFPGAFVG